MRPELDAECLVSTCCISMRALRASRIIARAWPNANMSSMSSQAPMPLHAFMTTHAG